MLVMLFQRSRRQSQHLSKYNEYGLQHRAKLKGKYQRVIQVIDDIKIDKQYITMVYIFPNTECTHKSSDISIRSSNALR